MNSGTTRQAEVDEMKNILYKLPTALIAVIFCFNLVIGQVYALSDSDMDSLYNNSVWYDSNTSLYCANSEIYAVSGNIDKGPGDGSIYKSGLSGPYILEQFMVHILKRLSQIYGQPESDFVTQEHVVALVAFAMGEGGDINNPSVFNPMNLGYMTSTITGTPWGGSDGTNGMLAYSSFDIGVEAYARQFSSGNQSRLGLTLSKPSSTVEDFFYALTYYEKYPGNKVWAVASLSNKPAYYRSRVEIAKSVVANYNDTAGLVIGTPEEELDSRLTRPDLLLFKELSKSNVGTTSSSFQEGETCSEDGQSTQTGLGVVEIAKREYKENRGIEEYGGDILEYTSGGRYAWCASFVSWVYKEAGYPLDRGGSNWNHPSVLELQSYMQKNHTYFEVGKQTPQPGDIAFYIGAQTPDGGSTQHVNIVISVNTADNTMVTIGGNESNQVMQNSRSMQLGDQGLVGFGRY